jgi:hypothetical protein
MRASRCEFIFLAGGVDASAEVSRLPGAVVALERASSLPDALGDLGRELSTGRRLTRERASFIAANLNSIKLTKK